MFHHPYYIIIISLIYVIRNKDNLKMGKNINFSKNCRFLRNFFKFFKYSQTCQIFLKSKEKSSYLATLIIISSLKITGIPFFQGPVFWHNYLENAKSYFIRKRQEMYTVKNFLKFDAHSMQNLERKFILFYHDLILMHFFMKLGNICMKINVCI